MDDSLNLADYIRLMRQMAHDMRGVLGVLTSTSDMFVNETYGALTPPQRRGAERLQRNSYRLLDLLEDFMVYIKAEAGDYILTPASFDPRVLFDRLCQQFQPQAQAKNIIMKCCVEENVPSMLIGDETAISRIIRALLSNAVAYTVQGSVCLTSGWTPDNQWLILVQDTGPGIPDHDIPHIYEPFWHGDNRPQTPAPGFGLGLSQARSLAKFMQGELRLKNTGPEGTSFELRLPIKNSPAS
jgi:signal transduction histidine kinase